MVACISRWPCLRCGSTLSLAYLTEQDTMTFYVHQLNLDVVHGFEVRTILHTLQLVYLELFTSTYGQKRPQCYHHLIRRPRSRCELKNKYTTTCTKIALPVQSMFFIINFSPILHQRRDSSPAHRGPHGRRIDTTRIIGSARLPEILAVKENPRAIFAPSSVRRKVGSIFGILRRLKYFSLRTG